MAWVSLHTDAHLVEVMPWRRLGDGRVLDKGITKGSRVATHSGSRWDDRRRADHQHVFITTYFSLVWRT